VASRSCRAVGAYQLAEASTDPDGGYHTEACHAVQHVAANFCFDLLTGQRPGEESPSNDGFVPIQRSSLVAGIQRFVLVIQGWFGPQS
jgi:hypothetical protein